MKELRDGRAFGVLARLDGNPIPQEVHFLLVRSDTAKYVFTLITPAKSHDPELGEQNSRAFGTVLLTLQPAK